MADQVDHIVEGSFLYPTNQERQSLINKVFAALLFLVFVWIGFSLYASFQRVPTDEELNIQKSEDQKRWNKNEAERERQLALWSDYYETHVKQEIPLFNSNTLKLLIVVDSVLFVAFVFIQVPKRKLLKLCLENIFGEESEIIKRIDEFLAKFRKKKFVYVADDEDPFRTFLSQILTEYGCEVKQFKNGEELFENIKKQKPEILFLDIKMPRMSGLDVLEALKHEGVEIDFKIIVISAFSGEFEHILKTLGAAVVVDKPTVINNLEKTIIKFI